MHFINIKDIDEDTIKYLKYYKLPNIPVNTSSILINTTSLLLEWKNSFIFEYGEEGILLFKFDMYGQIKDNAKFKEDSLKLASSVEEYYKSKTWTGD